MGLTKAERETILLFNEQEDSAVLFTCNSKLHRRFQEYARKHPDIAAMRSKQEFVVPKGLLTIKLREPTREETRQALRERAKANGLGAKIRGFIQPGGADRTQR